MIFEREKLRAAVQTALDEDRAQYDRQVTSYQREKDEARMMWLAEYADAWRDAAKAIIKLLDGEEVVREKDLPRTRPYGTLAIFGSTRTGTTAAPPPQYTPPRELVQLAAILDASSDKTISTSALKDLGFVNLRKIAPLMRMSP